MTTDNMTYGIHQLLLIEQFVLQEFGTCLSTRTMMMNGTHLSILVKQIEAEKKIQQRIRWVYLATQWNFYRPLGLLRASGHRDKWEFAKSSSMPGCCARQTS